MMSSIMSARLVVAGACVLFASAAVNNRPPPLQQLPSTLTVQHVTRARPAVSWIWPHAPSNDVHRRRSVTSHNKLMHSPSHLPVKNVSILHRHYIDHRNMQLARPVKIQRGSVPDISDIGSTFSVKRSASPAVARAGGRVEGRVPRGPGTFHQFVNTPLSPSDGSNCTFDPIQSRRAVAAPTRRLQTRASHAQQRSSTDTDRPGRQACPPCECRCTVQPQQHATTADRT